MKEHVDNNITLAKSIGIWILLEICMIKIFELFFSNNYLLYICIPLALLYAFLIYYSFKTRAILPFWRFLASISIILFFTYFVLAVMLKYVRMVYFPGIIKFMLACAVVTISSVAVLYGLTNVLRKFTKK
ncbi:hypothetical protein C9994_08600 [Marivirga lumbricoides]|uniref:Uncharacterized protein n=1 Tax=Marivirga lumbricoides TaxID=1046115 RepID=A0A2T4DQY0_9BACT|nr:hypothetical protein C9994_08600 [Marivirga lumbricoides]